LFFATITITLSKLAGRVATYQQQSTLVTIVIDCDDRLIHYY